MRLAFAYTVERICEKIYPTELVEIEFTAIQWHRLGVIANHYGMTPKEYAEKSIERLVMMYLKAGL